MELDHSKVVWVAALMLYILPFVLTGVVIVAASTLKTLLDALEYIAGDINPA